MSQRSPLAEYLALTEAGKEAIWIMKLAKELEMTRKCPLVLLGDNTGANSLAHNPKYHGRTKHWNIRLKWLRERVENGDFQVEYVPTEEQLADILTKPLARQRFEHLRTKLGVKKVSM